MVNDLTASNSALCNALLAGSPQAQSPAPPHPLLALTPPHRAAGPSPRGASSSPRRTTPFRSRPPRPVPLSRPMPGGAALPPLRSPRRRRAAPSSPRRRPSRRDQRSPHRLSQPLPRVLRQQILHHPPAPVVPRLALIPDQQHRRDQRHPDHHFNPVGAAARQMVIGEILLQKLEEKLDLTAEPTH